MSQNALKSLVFILFFSLNSCSYIATYQIVGVWRVVEIFENNKLLKDKTLDSVILQFNDEGQYTYQSTLNYKEAGNFEVKRNILVMSNHLSNEEKKLHIDALSSKKLVLLMEDAGKARKMVFTKSFN
jgi:hypothetical protein